jgi:hypothetical protein
MAFYDKLKWVLGILMVFVLIITTNLIDKNNFVRVRDSVVTIYEDRLIAKELIFEMLKSVHQKELAVLLSDSTFFNNNNTKVNAKLMSLISRFEQTKLTNEEENVFNDLKENIQSLLESERKLLNSDFNDNSQVVNRIESLKINLDDLSKIQINEGSRQMSISKRAIDTVELFTRIEIYLLVFLAIVIQIIVMYKPKDKS